MIIEEAKSKFSSCLRSIPATFYQSSVLLTINRTPHLIDRRQETIEYDVEAGNIDRERHKAMAKEIFDIEHTFSHLRKVYAKEGNAFVRGLLYSEWVLLCRECRWCDESVFNLMEVGS